MKSELAKLLQRLSQQQQHRIWLNRILQRTSPLVYYSALMFFLAGGIHQFMLPLNTLLITGIALGPSLLILCWHCIWQKPALYEGARHADKLFEANSLFISAWELCRAETDIKGTAKLLLSRCEKALPEWSQDNRQLPQKNLSPARMGIITLGIVGVFFLLQPSHVQVYKPPKATLNQKQALIAESEDNTARILGKLFNHGATSATPFSRHTGNPSTLIGPSKSAPPQMSEQYPRSKDSKANLGIPMSDKELSLFSNKHGSVMQGVLPDSRPIAGTITGNAGIGDETAKPANSAITQADEFDKTERINIETGMDQLSKASDELNQGYELIASNPEQAILHPATNNPSRGIVSNSSITLLSAQKRSLVWRYFKQLDENDAQRE